MGREFGNGVRHAIEQSGLTQRQLAELLDWQEAKVSDLVQGKGGVDEAELRELLAYCRVDRDESRRLVALFNESREKGWLLFPEDGVPEQLRSLIDQERQASKIIVWSMNLVARNAGPSDAQLRNLASQEDADVLFQMCRGAAITIPSNKTAPARVELIQQVLDAWRH